MDIITWVVLVASLLVVGFILGAVFNSLAMKDAKDIADEFVRAKESVIAEGQSILSRLRSYEADAITKAEAIKKAL